MRGAITGNVLAHSTFILYISYGPYKFNCDHIECRTEKYCTKSVPHWKIERQTEERENHQDRGNYSTAQTSRHHAKLRDNSFSCISFNDEEHMPHDKQMTPPVKLCEDFALTAFAIKFLKNLMRVRRL